MSGGVFCPACGTPCTWFPQLQQWGCDRCRVMLPAAAAPPQMQATPMAPPAKRGSRAPLVIGGVLLLGGIITVAVVASGSGSSKKTSASASEPTATTTTSSAPTKSSPAKAPTLGEPQQAPVGDFWLWPRSDGSFLVTSADMTAVFPRKPTFKLTPASAKTGEESGDMYTITDAYGDHGKIELTIAATGRKLRDTGPMKAPASLAKLGTVSSRTFSDRGLDVTEYLVESDQGAGSIRMNLRSDREHGLLMSAMFGAMNDAPHASFVDEFARDLHLDASHDVAGDLASITSKATGDRFVVGDAQFHIELPWEPKIEHGRQHDTAFAKIAISHGDALATLLVTELPGWLALHTTSVSLDQDSTDTADALTKAFAAQHATSELARAKFLDSRVIKIKTAQGVAAESWSVWDRFAHRGYQLTCVRTDCTAIMRTLTLTPAKPAPPAN